MMTRAMLQTPWAIPVALIIVDGSYGERCPSQGLELQSVAGRQGCDVGSLPDPFLFFSVYYYILKDH
jgi:hypothetical protein